MLRVLLQLPVGVPWRRICVPMESDKRRNIYQIFLFSLVLQL